MGELLGADGTATHKTTKLKLDDLKLLMRVWGLRSGATRKEEIFKELRLHHATRPAHA